MHAGKALAETQLGTETPATEHTETPTEGDPKAEVMMAESEPTEAISPCDACKAAVEGACYGLIIGGAIAAAPEEGAIAAVVLGLTAAGLVFGADQVRAWIKEAISAGIHTAKDLAEFFCKKAGVC